MTNEEVHWTSEMSLGYATRKCDEAMGKVLDEDPDTDILHTRIGRMAWYIEDITCHRCLEKVEEEIDTIAQRGED